MSLTSHLADTQSPVRQFLRARLPVSRSLTKAATAQMAAATSILPPAWPGYPWGTIGHAIDYRLRFSFAVTPFAQLVAANGASMIDPQDPLLQDRLNPSLQNLDADDYRLHAALVFDTLEHEVQRLDPVRRRLVRAEEAWLARCCFALGLFEEVARAGLTRVIGFSPLLNPTLKLTAEELLACAPQDCVDDLVALSWGFFDALQPLLDAPGVVLNPTFTGSLLVGGADADLIVDRCLIEIKTTKTATFATEWLQQALGYTLLDLDDTYGIEAVAIYLSRQRLLLRWSLADLLGVTVGEVPPALATLRENFRDCLLRQTEPN